MKHRLHIFSFVLAALLCSASLWAESVTSESDLPAYYAGLTGTSGTSLVTALKNVCNVSTFSADSYATVWTNFATTDVYPSDSTGKAGKLWDMYSNVLWTVGEKKCGSYSNVGSCYNREHSLPKSWFGVSDSPPAGPGTDMHHMYPTDGYVNNQRSNYPFGECSGGTYLSNGSNKGIGRLGTSTLSGYTSVGTVWEPADEFKGDFARTYMYMLMKWCANGTSFTQDGTYGKKTFNNTFTSDGNYGLTDYGVALLMKWHRQDPVSRKERDRNNAVQSVQGNRNPFIDYPCLAEYLWGDKKDEIVTISSLTLSYSSSFTDEGCPCEGPTITSPTGTVNIGTTNTSNSIYKDVTVQGTNLESGSLTLTIGGTNGSYFKLPGGASSATVSKANAEAGYNITITYTPTSNGSHTATLTISGCGITSHVVTLTGTCTTVYTATWMADGSQVGTSYAASGTSPDVPASTPSCTASRVFMGWTATSGYTGSSAPANMFTDEAPTMTTDKTFYAVYADKETSGGGSPVVSTAFSTTSLGSTNSVTAGYTVSATASAKTGYYQDGSGTSGVTIYNTTTPMFTSTPSAISLTVSIGAGSGNLDFANYVYATLVNGSGTAVGTAVEITNHVTTSTGDSYTVSIPTTGVTSANGIYLYHTKESGQNIRYYSASLSITTGGGTTTYSNYSTQCTACTPVAATASYAHSSRTTTCGGTVSNTFTTNSNATVSYTSTNTSVATVASDGTVTPVGQGSATITATVPANTCFTGGASASFTLTVNRNTGTASFSGATTTVNKDATVTNVVTTNSDGAVTYSSSNTSVATVNASGVVTGVSAGTATITANVAQSTCYTAASANYTITVYDFKANAATDVTCESFTANWNTSGAATYSLDVYHGTSSSTTVSRDTTITYDFVSALTWTSQYVSGTSDIWSHNTTYGAYGKGASGTASESWLISPELDFSDVTTASLTMNHTFRYGESSQLSVKYSTDGGSTWNNATLSNWGDGNNWTFVDATADLSATCGNAHVKLAFVYTCTKSSYATWEIKTLSITGTYDKTISTSSVEHVSGYPKNVSGTSASVTGLDASTTYKYTVTPQGGSASNEIEVTTPACSCSRTITATSNDDSRGTVEVTLP